jgi:hypothetical protein
MTENDVGPITCLNVKKIKILFSCVVHDRPQATSPNGRNQARRSWGIRILITFKNTQHETTKALRLILYLIYEKILEDFSEKSEENVIMLGLV